MSPDLFPKYLKDTSLLYRISYEELKTLVVQYPYCQNLRYLLLVKSKMDGNVEQERNLKMASAYSQDRTQLYLLLKKDLKEVHKEFEFLDLNHAVTDDNHPELELPVLDFSNGIEAKEKRESSLVEELDLSLVSEQIKPEKTIEEDTPILNKDFSDDDIIVQEGYGTDDDLFSLFEDDEEDEIEEEEDVEIPEETAVSDVLVNDEQEVSNTWASPLVPPVIDFVFEEAEPELVIEETPIVPIVVWNSPLVPPSIDLIFATEEIIEEPEIIATEPIIFNMVPPSVDLGFIQIIEEEVIPIEENNLEDSVAAVFNLPLVPPLHQISFEVEIEVSPIIKNIVALRSLPIIENDDDKQSEESNFGTEIDQSIQAALDRLAKAQQIEIEEEEASEESRIKEIVKKRMLFEGIVKTEEEFEIAAKSEIVVQEEKEEIPVEEKPQEEHSGPMPKASFNSWLKQMAAPVPSPKLKYKKETKSKDKDSSSSDDDYFAKPKKKKKGKKKKRVVIENEASLLLKAIKSRQEKQVKAESKMMRVRKKTIIALAERSLKENEEIVSETLAKILVIQGKKDKAEHMYRRLILKFPKKSGYFAAEIKKVLK